MKLHQLSLVESILNEKRKKLMKEQKKLQQIKELQKKNSTTLQTKQDLAKQGENYYNFLVEEKKLQRQQLQSQGLAFSENNIGLFVGSNEKLPLQSKESIVGRRRRNLKNFDSNYQKSQKNDSSVENESTAKIQKLKEKMNLVSDQQINPYDQDIMNTLLIKPVNYNLSSLYSPLKLPLKQKSNSQYSKKEDGIINSPIDNYILKKLEKIAEGNKEQQSITQISPERVNYFNKQTPQRQIKKLLPIQPIQSSTRHKNSFFESTGQRHSVDFQSEQFRENTLQEAQKQQQNPQLSQVYSQLKQLSSNRYSSIKNIEFF